MGFVALAAVALIAGAIYEHLARLSLPRDYPPPGILVAVAGRHQQLNCTGTGEPTVVLESGFAPYGSLGWFAVQPVVSNLTRTCSYDRAGYLWSDRSAKPRDGIELARELHELLAAASVFPPYVLVGHSGGGILVRIYDHEFPGEAAGFVFVESSHPEQQRRLPKPATGSTPPAAILEVLTGTGLWRFVVHAPRPSHVPPKVHDAILAYWPLSIHALAAELAVVDETAREVPTPGLLGSRPIVVLTRSNFGVEFGDPEGLVEQSRAAWTQMQQEIAALSVNSVHRTVPNTSHELQIDAPEAVVEAISDVVDAVRTGEPLVRHPPREDGDRSQ
jgi:pimeloyl-ACP methyl ester carboxylesterase